MDIEQVYCFEYSRTERVLLWIFDRAVDVARLLFGLAYRVSPADIATLCQER